MRTMTILFLAAVGYGDDGIEWAQDLADAKARSKTSGKPLLAYFTFDT